VKEILLVDEDSLRREVVNENWEAVIALGFALKPTTFIDKVTVQADPVRGPDYFKCTIKETGNTYILNIPHVVRTAIEFARRSRQPIEVFRTLKLIHPQRGSNPIPA